MEVVEPVQRVARRLANLFDSVDGLDGSSSGNIRLARNRVRIADAYATTRPEGLFVDDPVLVVEVLSPSTRAEDLLRKPHDYAAAGIGQLWIVDPAQRWLEVRTLVDGSWHTLARFDEARPFGEVAIGEHGVVTVDLLGLLDD
ncbi:hypothetical protein GCM10022237_41250 [Nocardioides ginsengisoli]|uniref:Uma2 family endonuclease n=1 Tax=Nocardioides ginsengisoli TaxID=363868 RepID=A0ABW3W610_9ACTN